MKPVLSRPALCLSLTLIFIYMLLCGCSSSYQVESDNLAEVNSNLKGEDVTVELWDGKEIEVQVAMLSLDSLWWIGENGITPVGAKYGEFRRVVKHDYGLGLLEGLGLGLLAGASVGAGVGEAAAPKSEILPGWFVGGIIGGLAGGIVGLMIGGNVGHSYVYEFPSAAVSDSNILIEKSYSRMDVVYLKNGQSVEGKILEEVRSAGKIIRITIRDADGVTHTYPASEIKGIKKAGKN